MYGLYLTLSSWVLYHVAARDTFFQTRLGLFSLNDTADELVAGVSEAGAGARARARLVGCGHARLPTPVSRLGARHHSQQWCWGVHKSGAGCALPCRPFARLHPLRVRF